METKLLAKDGIAEAAELLRAGGAVAVPTETVYGLCCNGLDERAVRHIYELKGRPEVKPLSLMVSSFDEAGRYCTEAPPQATALADRFMPGPITIILPSRSCVPEIVRAGGSTIGLRCPDHPMTLELLRALGLPLAGPSANPSGEPSPKNAAAVMRYFDGKIEGVLDGGEGGVGVESTVIDMSRTPYRILRAGALTGEQIFSALAEAMTVIGITGGTGSGKTTALAAVRERGGLVIDCDEVYHELLESGGDMLDAITARFPGCAADGKFDRKALGREVFASPGALLELNAITHPYISAEVGRRLRAWVAEGGTLAAVDAIALIESGIAERCSALVAVTAPRSERVRRLMLREGISREYAESRIDAQRPDEYYREHCDYVLENDGGVEEFAEKCRSLIDSLTGGKTK